MVARPFHEVHAVVVVHAEHLAPVDLHNVVLCPQSSVVGDGAIVDLEREKDRKESIDLINPQRNPLKCERKIEMLQPEK